MCIKYIYMYKMSNAKDSHYLIIHNLQLKKGSKTHLMRREQRHLSSLEEGRLRGDLNFFYSFLKKCAEGGINLFLHIQRMHGVNAKLQLRRFRLDTVTTSFSMRVVRYQNRLPREVVDVPCPSISKKMFVWCHFELLIIMHNDSFILAPSWLSSWSKWSL